MAKSKRGRRYRLTPRRRAAILKAQSISARKRKRTLAKRVGIGAGIAGTVAIAGVAGYAGRSYVRQLAGGGPRQKTSTSKEIDIIRIAPAPVGPGNWHLVGKPAKTHLKTLPRRRKRLNYVESERKRVTGIYRRDKKITNQRRKYWKAKPVGGLQRKVRKDKGTRRD